MPKNPLYTPAQKAIEDKAMALLTRPEMERVKSIIAMLFRNAVAWPSRGQMDRFDGMIDEYLFHHAMRAANGDPNHPVAARFMVPRHHWFGRQVPGSRWGGFFFDDGNQNLIWSPLLMTVPRMP